MNNGDAHEHTNKGRPAGHNQVVTENEDNSFKVMKWTPLGTSRKCTVNRETGTGEIKNRLSNNISKNCAYSANFNPKNN